MPPAWRYFACSKKENEMPLRHLVFRNLQILTTEVGGKGRFDQQHVD